MSDRSKKDAAVADKPSLSSVAVTSKRSEHIQVLSSEKGMYPSIAKTLMRPEVGAASAIEQWQRDTHDVNALASELSAQVEAVNRGDMRRPEGMLVAQAHTLHDVFNILLRRATTQQYLSQWETYMRMAMKAQSQCRMTLETLSEMKNPKAVAFVKQANIANGPQQVNNGVAESRPVRAGARAVDSSVAPGKLLEQHNGEWVDTGTTSTSGGADSQLEAVAARDRPAH